MRHHYAVLSMLCASALCVSLDSPAHANPILDITGGTGGGPAILLGQVIEASWTQSGGYSDVSISVPLFSWTPNNPFDGTAFLTTSIGPASIPPPLASASFSGVTSDMTPAQITLFSGLFLSPGTYYLTLSSTDSGGPFPGSIWVLGDSAVADHGVTAHPYGYANTVFGRIDGAYPPGSTFVPTSEGLARLTVDGTPVPEPGSLVLLASGLLGLIGMRRRGLLSL